MPGDRFGRHAQQPIAGKAEPVEVENRPRKTFVIRATG
jgi:hypothetical protein